MDVQGLKVYTVKEASAKLGTRPETLRAMLKAGRIRARKIGSKWLITEEALRAYLEDADDAGLYTDIEHKRLYAACIAGDGTTGTDAKRRAYFYLLAGQDELAKRGVDAFYDFDGRALRTEATKTEGLSAEARTVLAMARALLTGQEQTVSLHAITSLSAEGARLAINALRIRTGLQRA